MNLNEARRLHDLCPHEPANCITCRDETWPCPTALALGATGRSEWTDTPSSAMTTQCHATGTTESGPSQCVLTTSHHGDHTAPNGLIIEPGNPTDPADTPIGICGYDVLHDGDRCVLAPNHHGQHVYRGTGPHCTRSIHNMTCVREDEHGGVHVNRNGTRYSNCGSTGTTTTGTHHYCARTAGHIGDHATWEGGHQW